MMTHPNSDLSEESFAIKSLIARLRTPDTINDFPTTTDLDELFQSPGMIENTRLWRTSSGDAYAYAIVHFPYNNLNFEIDAAFWKDALEDEIQSWAEKRMLERYGADLADQTLDGNCRVENTRMLRFYQRQGYLQEEIETLGYRVRMSEIPPEPSLPAGFVIRPLDPLHEFEAVVSLHQAAYGTQLFSAEDRHALMNTPAYQPGLDLVCVAPDGSLAGNCICGKTEPLPGMNDEPEGFTDPVVVHPDFQKRGIATALLQSGLRGLFKNGITRVNMGTSNVNAGMRRAAEAAGFTCVSHHVWFSKIIQ